MHNGIVYIILYIHVFSPLNQQVHISKTEFVHNNLLQELLNMTLTLKSRTSFQKELDFYLK